VIEEVEVAEEEEAKPAEKEQVINQWSIYATFCLVLNSAISHHYNKVFGPLNQIKNKLYLCAPTLNLDLNKQQN
jgi:hypothetical protein